MTRRMQPQDVDAWMARVADIQEALANLIQGILVKNPSHVLDAAVDIKFRAEEIQEGAIEAGGEVS